MKVQSWGDFITALALLILATAGLLYRRPWYNGMYYVAGLLLLFVALTLLYTSLSEKKHQKMIRQQAEDRRIRREMFGRLGPVAPYVGPALLLASNIVLRVTDASLIPFLISILGLICIGWLSIAINRRRERGADAETPPDDSPER